MILTVKVYWLLTLHQRVSSLHVLIYIKVSQQTYYVSLRKKKKFKTFYYKNGQIKSRRKDKMKTHIPTLANILLHLFHFFFFSRSFKMNMSA